MGFHSGTISPLLERHWPWLSLRAGSRALVPLAGKSIDMLLLRERRHRVPAVELSAMAVEPCLDECGLQPTVREASAGRRFVAGQIELIRGTVFDLGASEPSDCVGAYDRAALIAPPADVPQRHATHLPWLVPFHGQMLPMYALDYTQGETEGRPFAPGENEARAIHVRGRHRVEMLEWCDSPAQIPGFAACGMTHRKRWLVGSSAPESVPDQDRTFTFLGAVARPGISHLLRIRVCASFPIDTCPSDAPAERMGDCPSCPAGSAGRIPSRAVGPTWSRGLCSRRLRIRIDRHLCFAV